jgi:hypothetical protein
VYVCACVCVCVCVCVCESEKALGLYVFILYSNTESIRHNFADMYIHIITI